MSFRDLLGKFVVFDETKPAPPAAPSAPKAAPAVADPPSPAASPAAQLGDSDLADLYRKNGIPQAALTAEQALDILRTLPEGLSPEIQRQAFTDLLRKKGASLGVPPEAVLEEARRKIAVLSTAVQEMPERLSDFVAAAQREIDELTEQLKERQEAIEAVKEEQRQSTQRWRSEIERLTTVLQLLQTPGGNPQ